MSTLSTCPYCGLQLGMASMRGHLVLCSRGPGRNNGGKTDASPVEKSSSAAALAPSRPSAPASVPAVVRVDLRSKSVENSSVKNGTQRDVDPHPERRRRSSLIGSSSTLPTSSPSCVGGGQHLKADVCAGSGLSLSTGDVGSKTREGDARNDMYRDELADGESDGGAILAVDPQMERRVLCLEAATKELRAALIFEREAREKTSEALEDILSFLRSELSKLHARVDDVSKGAEDARRGAEDLGKRVEILPTREALGELQRKVESLLSSLPPRRGKEEPPCDVVSGGGRFTPLPQDMSRSAASCGDAGGERRRVFGETPFLSHDTGEVIAQFLHLRPTAMIQTPGKMPSINVQVAGLGRK